MIKINLLPQRKPKKTAEPGQLEVSLVMAGVMAAAALVYVGVHRPAKAKAERILTEADDVAGRAQRLKARVADLSTLEAAVAVETKRKEAIDKLVGTTIVPDNVLFELSRILTSEGPTMSAAMTTLTGSTNDADPNRRFSPDWDPRHVWLKSFTTKGDVFTLEGGAQAESDIPQLAKRMAASVYFTDVTSPSSKRVEAGAVTGARATGVEAAYYEFTLSGKVLY